MHDDGAMTSLVRLRTVSLDAVCVVRLQEPLVLPDVGSAVAAVRPELCESAMPLVQYFTGVGAVLLALLMVVGSYLPHQTDASNAVRYDIRVRADRVGPLVAGPTTFADFSGTLQPQGSAAVLREAMAKASPVEIVPVKPPRAAHLNSKRAKAVAENNAPPVRVRAPVTRMSDTGELGAGWRY